MSFKRNFNTLIVKSNNLKSELSYSSNGIKLHNYDLNNNLISKGKVFNSSNSFSKSFFNVDFLDNSNYKNSNNFVNTLINARKYENDHEKLIIIAGACQSNYEQLIKAGANFASSPKRINIHALDPAIVASSVSLSNRGKPIDLINILKKTKYGTDGMGGIITNGTMYVGYPR